MIGIDTNVLVRYLADDDPIQSDRAAQEFAALSGSDPGFVATVVWVEAYWVLTRAYKQPRAEVLSAFASLTDVEEIRPEDPQAVADAVAAARGGADFADALIASAARRNGCSETITFDAAASKKLGWRLLSHAGR